MTRLDRTTAAVLSVLVTLGTLAAADALATQQYLAADSWASAHVQRLALQQVVVVARRAA